MRVPDLDWPADLFADVAPVAEHSDRDVEPPLWAIMQGLWMRRAPKAELADMAA